MSSIFDEAVQEYHDEFKTLPLEYYDAGSCEWREEFTRQPPAFQKRVPTEKDFREFNERWNAVIERYRKAWRSDKTPSDKRDRLFYAQRYASFYSVFARMAEKSSCVSQTEYDKLSEQALRYQELEAKLEGKKAWQFYSCSVVPPCVGSLPYDGDSPEWQKLKTWDGEPATSLKWRYWPD